MIAPVDPCILALATPQYVVVSMLAIVVFGLWVRARQEKLPLAEVAREHDFCQHHDDANGVLDRFGDLELLRRGHCRQALDVMTGTSRTRELTCFRFLTELGARSRRQLVQFVVVALELPSELQDVRLGKDRALATSLRKAALVDMSEPRRSAYCYMTPTDQSHIAAGLLTAWLTEQPKEFAWQMTPGIVAGFARFPATAEQIAQLIAATIDLAEVVLESPATEEQNAIR